jgi:hypothetical protein
MVSAPAKLPRCHQYRVERQRGRDLTKIGGHVWKIIGQPERAGASQIREFFNG